MSRSARDGRAANFKAYVALVALAFYLIAEYVGGKATSSTSLVHDR